LNAAEGKNPKQAFFNEHSILLKLINTRQFSIFVPIHFPGMGSRDLNSIYLISAQFFDQLCDLSQQLPSPTIRML